ncbi:MAG: type IV pilus biogenesis/stability protein PilW [Chromatiales bacterium]|nr:type IV pilus biogenesis/stability protein PilW [Chromatiales bacterium]
MKNGLTLLLASALLLLSGCASDGGVKDGVDVDSAAEANANLGLRYMQNGNYELALKKLKRALDFKRSHAPAHHYLAELYRRLGKYDEADDHFENAIYYSEGDADLLNNYGAYLCSRKRYSDGEAQFLKVLDKAFYSRQDLVYENLGLCVENKPDIKRAEKYLRKALEMNQQLPKSLLGMARITLAKGEFLSTRAYLQRFNEISRHTPESLWMGIRAERELGDKNAIASYGMQLKGKFPDADETRLYLQSGGE